MSHPDELYYTIKLVSVHETLNGYDLLSQPSYMATSTLFETLSIVERCYTTYSPSA